MTKRLAELFDISESEAKKLLKVRVADLAAALDVQVHFPKWLDTPDGISFGIIEEFCEKGGTSLLASDFHDFSEEHFDESKKEMLEYIEMGPKVSMDFGLVAKPKSWPAFCRDFHMAAIQGWIQSTYCLLAESLPVNFEMDKFLPFDPWDAISYCTPLDFLGIKVPSWFPPIRMYGEIKDLVELLNDDSDEPNFIPLFCTWEKVHSTNPEAMSKIRHFFAHEKGNPLEGESFYHSACRLWLSRVTIRLEDKLDDLTNRERI
ncbi:MAG TPA: hypothetical protein V6C65_42065, partial [Allocoleopsis sp.]